MKKLLLFLLTTLAAITTTAQNDLYLLFNNHWGPADPSGTTGIKMTYADGAYTATLDLSTYNLANAETLWFRFYDGTQGKNVCTSEAFRFKEPITVYTYGEGESNWTTSPSSTGCTKMSFRVVKGEGTTWTATVYPVETTVYFLTPYNDKTVSIWGWYADGQAADGFTNWSQRPTMTADGTETYGGTTHYKYKYTFTGKEPAYLNIDEGGLEVIKGAACESSKKYIYEKTARTVTIVDDQPWGNVYAYTWDWDGQTGGADAGKKFGAWPGAKLNGYDGSIGSLAVAESVQDNVTTYTMTVSDYLRNWSDNLIISNGDDKQKTVSLANGSEYHTVPDQTFTVYFKKPDGWTKVYAYTWEPETEGAFPGTEAALVDATEQIYSWSYSGWLPKEVIFSGGTGGDEGVAKTSIAVRDSENNGKTFQLDGTEVPVSGSGDSSELAPKSEDAGHDVIYQMNIGSFTATGTFAAATSELTNLKAKGIDIIWVMPIFKRDGGLNSPYAATAYDQFQYGTAAEFSTFVSTAHTLGMKVWLDWAANHNSTSHTWVNAHPEYYAKDGNQMLHPGYYDGDGFHPYNDVYQLDLRDSNPSAQEAMIAEMKKFVDGTYTTGGAAIDGFRCDMVTGWGNYLPKSFWSKAISELREVKPELKFLAETDIHKHTQDSLATCGFDFDYAWDFHDELVKAGASATDVKEAADIAAT